jgi:hypothetical protein
LVLVEKSNLIFFFFKGLSMKSTQHVIVATSIFAAAAMTGMLAGAARAEGVAPGAGHVQAGLVVRMSDTSKDGKQKNSCKGKNGCKSLTLAAGAGIANPGVASATMFRAAHTCKGKNSCKGKGGCKTASHSCAGKNSCSGKGGCNTTVPSA